MIVNAVAARRLASPNMPPRCPVCDGSTGWDGLAVREMMFGTREVFEYGQCRDCASLVIATVPADLARHYPDRYYANDAPTLRDDGPLARAAMRVLVREKAFKAGGPLTGLARRFASIPDEYRQVRTIVIGADLRSFDAPILDVGCGRSPARLAILRRLGYRRLLGIEPYIDADTTYQGVPIRRGHLADVPGRFRLIMFHHSLEHVADPYQTLRDARARVRPDGLCLVRTPIVGGRLWRDYGVDWVELDAPRHLVVFSVRGLERLAERTGFEIVRTTWESSAWDFIASEQYRRDLGLYEPGSWTVDPSAAAFDPAAVARYTEWAQRANEAGDAGRAAFWLHAVTGA